MVVHTRDRSRRRRSYVRKATPRTRVGRNAPKVEVVQGRLDRLVHGWSQALTKDLAAVCVEVGFGERIPRESKPIDVVDSIAGIDLLLLVVDIDVGIMVDKLGKEVLMDLFGEGVFGTNEDVF